MEKKKKCANCRRDLDLGVDVLSVGEGVIGMKGFVPLESPMFFCCEKCLKEYIDLDDLPSMPGRLP